MSRADPRVNFTEQGFAQELRRMRRDIDNLQRKQGITFTSSGGDEGVLRSWSATGEYVVGETYVEAWNPRITEATYFEVISNFGGSNNALNCLVPGTYRVSVHGGWAWTSDPGTGISAFLCRGLERNGTTSAYTTWPRAVSPVHDYGGFKWFASGQVSVVREFDVDDYVMVENYPTDTNASHSLFRFHATLLNPA